MRIFTDRTDPEIIKSLKKGHIGVLLTDTLYGIVARASDAAAVERLYAIRQREKNKPCILLIADSADMYTPVPSNAGQLLRSVWPGPVSVIMPAPDAPAYLPKLEGTLAYRLPDDNELCHILQETGPLLAPSANLPGQQPAQNLAEAQAYFGDTVDFYVDSGQAPKREPSQIIAVNSEGQTVRLR